MRKTSDSAIGTGGQPGVPVAHQGSGHCDLTAPAGLQSLKNHVAFGRPQGVQIGATGNSTWSSASKASVIELMFEYYVGLPTPRTPSYRRCG